MLSISSKQISPHGCYAVGAATLTGTRAIWGICCAVAYGTLVFLIYQSVRKLNTRPVSIVLELKSQQVPFPAVTMCNLNPLMKHKIHKAPKIAALMKAYKNLMDDFSKDNTLEKKTASGAKKRSNREISDSDCPTGWLDKPNACYKSLGPSTLLRSAAEAGCRNLHPNATLPNFRDENDYSELIETRQTLAMDGKMLWISISSQHVKNQYLVEDKDANRTCPSPWSNWANKEIARNTLSHCGFIQPADDLWFIANCAAAKRNVICQLAHFSICDASRGDCPEGWLYSSDSCYKPYNYQKGYGYPDPCNQIHPKAQLSVFRDAIDYEGFMGVSWIM